MVIVNLDAGMLGASIPGLRQKGNRRRSLAENDSPWGTDYLTMAQSSGNVIFAAQCLPYAVFIFLAVCMQLLLFYLFYEPLQAGF